MGDSPLDGMANLDQDRSMLAKLRPATAAWLAARSRLCRLARAVVFMVRLPGGHCPRASPLPHRPAGITALAAAGLDQPRLRPADGGRIHVWAGPSDRCASVPQWARGELWRRQSIRH